MSFVSLVKGEIRNRNSKSVWGQTSEKVFEPPTEEKKEELKKIAMLNGRKPKPVDFVELLYKKAINAEFEILNNVALLNSLSDKQKEQFCSKLMNRINNTKKGERKELWDFYDQFRDACGIEDEEEK